MQKNSSAGFAIGLILVVIVLMAAIATMMSATSVRFDITREISDLDVASFRDTGQNLAASISRSAVACSGSMPICMNAVQQALQTPACEQSTVPGVFQNCPYASPYGSASRRPMAAKLFAFTPTPNWRVVHSVSSPGSNEQNHVVVAITGLTDALCLAIEARVQNIRTATLVNGPMLDNSLSDLQLPFARREGCYHFIPNGPSTFKAANIYFLIAHTVRP